MVANYPSLRGMVWPYSYIIQVNRTIFRLNRSIFRINGTIFRINGSIFRANRSIFRVYESIFRVNGTRCWVGLSLLKITYDFSQQSIFHLYWAEENDNLEKCLYWFSTSPACHSLLYLKFFFPPWHLQDKCEAAMIIFLRQTIVMWQSAKGKTGLL